MGSATSKGDKSEALRLCKERKKFIKQAIDSRYSLAATHVSYVESLRNIGISLRRYAEAEILIEPSISTSANEVDKTPSHSSYPSASPSHTGGVSDSPILNGSPLSQPTARMSYMMTGGSSTLTVRVNHVTTKNIYMDDGDFSTPPPPPPPPEFGSSWDFFDPLDVSESFRFLGQDNVQPNFDDGKPSGGRVGEICGDNETDEVFVTPKSEASSNSKLVVYNGNSALQQKLETNGQSAGYGEVKEGSARKGDGSTGKSVGKVSLEQSVSKKDRPVGEKDVCAEREDPSEFITHRAKDFLSSIKDIEHRFFRASESGREVSRMLEANKIRVGYDQAKGKSPASAYLASFRKVCCQGRNANVTADPERATKVITWKRTSSSRSSSSRNPLTATSKDENDDSGNDFMEEFCMIAGSNSSTLDRLYAWERKLYDEVKASEIIRREYDAKCIQLRQQCAKDLSTQVIDKTRAVVKDLHSRIRVALHSVDSISKRIEKMRDEELLPQLLELLQGLIRMWKVMLECHHAQYITISLAYHTKNPAKIHQEGSQNEILLQLQDELECFGLSFANWINSLTSYVESLNSWLQICIMLPQERSKNRRAFSPRRVLAPPIFALCRDWSVGIKSLPSEELSNAIMDFLHDILHAFGQVDEPPKEEITMESHETGESDPNTSSGDKTEGRSLTLSSLQSGLTKIFDRLTKFSEASLKMSEDVKQKCETARNAYLSYRPPARSFTI